MSVIVRFKRNGYEGPVPEAVAEILEARGEVEIVGADGPKEPEAAKAKGDEKGDEK